MLVECETNIGTSPRRSKIEKENRFKQFRNDLCPIPYSEIVIALSSIIFFILLCYVKECLVPVENVYRPDTGDVTNHWIPGTV